MALPSDDLLSSASFRSRVSGQRIPRSTAHGHRDDPSRKDTRLCSGNGAPAVSGMAATPNAPSVILEREEHERQHQTRGTVHIYDQSTCGRRSRVTGPPRGLGWRDPAYELSANRQGTTLARRGDLTAALRSGPKRTLPPRDRPSRDRCIESRRSTTRRLSSPCWPASSRALVPRLDPFGPCRWERGPRSGSTAVCADVKRLSGGW